MFLARPEQLDVEDEENELFLLFEAWSKARDEDLVSATLLEIGL
jgi:hypothetical protein